jgi:hypothetical protein
MIVIQDICLQHQARRGHARELLPLGSTKRVDDEIRPEVVQQKEPIHRPRPSRVACSADRFML